MVRPLHVKLLRERPRAGLTACHSAAANGRLQPRTAFETAAVGQGYRLPGESAASARSSRSETPRIPAPSAR